MDECAARGTLRLGILQSRHFCRSARRTRGTWRVFRATHWPEPLSLGQHLCHLGQNFCHWARTSIIGPEPLSSISEANKASAIVASTRRPTAKISSPLCPSTLTVHGGGRLAPNPSAPNQLSLRFVFVSTRSVQGTRADARIHGVGSPVGGRRGGWRGTNHWPNNYARPLAREAATMNSPRAKQAQRQELSAPPFCGWWAEWPTHVPSCSQRIPILGGVLRSHCRPLNRFNGAVVIRLRQPSRPRGVGPQSGQMTGRANARALATPEARSQRR